MRSFPRDFRLRGGVYLPLGADDETGYTDGEASEAYLAEALARAADLSSDSPELDAAVRDWPSHYHLGSERANLFRALTLRDGLSVLELGCGCGAMTRWLGENARAVTAIEGSPARARLARSRCRDLDNVRIVAGNFDDVSFEETFDVATLIGVLEYANLYHRGAGDPFEATLRAARSQLGDDGVLILAIENKLGVKYLAGCAEDHGEGAFAGVEGYPGDRGARTFGRHELLALLRRSGFEDAQLLLPFPDYKIPSTVLNAEAAGAREAAALNLVDWCRQPYEERGGSRNHPFSDHLALASFAANGLLPDVANSFLVLAAARPFSDASAIERVDWIAKKFNPRRRPSYRTVVTLTRRNGRPVLQKHGSIGGAAADPMLSHAPEPETPYIEGAVSLSMLMLRALRRRTGAREAFAAQLRAWVEFLRAEATGAPPGETLPGEWLDSTPDNILVGPEGALHAIDAEWRWAEPVPLDWLIYRGLRAFHAAHEPFVAAVVGEGDSGFPSFFTRCLAEAGLSASRERIRDLAAMERDLQSRVNAHSAAASGATRRSPDRVRSYRHVAETLARRFRPRGVAVLGGEAAALAAALAAKDIEVAAGPVRDLAVWIDSPDAPAPEQPDAWAEAMTTGAREAIVGAGRAVLSFTSAFEARGWRVVPDVDVSFVARGALLFRREGALRVTLVAPTSNLHGGVAVIYRHAAKLAERGHLVTVASLDEVPPDWIELPDAVRFLPVGGDLAALEDALPDADALVATVWTTAGPVARAAASKGRKFYLVQGYESLWAGEPDDVDATYTELPLEKLAVSSFLESTLRETLGEASRLVRNGCDFSGTLSEPRGAKRRGAPRIGMLHHESPWKGLADGLAAFEAVRREIPSAELVLYGVRRPAALPPGCVAFHETPTRDELAAMLDTLDVFVFPSLTEGFGLPPLEAMCRGVAVVATDCGGSRDFAIDGETALVSPPGDRGALARNLLAICRDDALRARLAAAGLARANTFGWDASAAEMERALGAGGRAKPLNILYAAAGPVWFDTYLDDWLVRGLESLGHRVSRFDPHPPNWRYSAKFVHLDNLDEQRVARFRAGAGRPPSELVQAARREAPDLVFFNHGLLYPPEVLDRLRRLGVPTAAWMVDEPQEMFFSANRGRLFDYVFLQDRGSLAHHRSDGNPNTFFMPHGADPVDHRPRSAAGGSGAEDRSDILLIGTGFPARRELVRSLAGLDADVLVVGRHWEGLDLANVRVRNKPVTAEEAGRLYRGAAMTLNLHRGRKDWATGEDVAAPASPNGSFFHIAACGSLQLVDREFPGAAEFLEPGRQFVAFGSRDELFEAVGHYLERHDERDAVAADAAEAAHRHQTYAHRLRDALAQIGSPRSHRRVHGVARPARGDEDVMDAAAAAPLQSVVIASRGSVEQLRACLLGVAGVASDPCRIVVVHPPSGALSRWLDDRAIAHREVADARGLSGAFNEGVRASEGAYVVFVTDGMLATPHFGRRLIARLEADQKLAMVGPAIHPSGGPQSIAAAYRSIEELKGAARSLYLAHREHLEEIAALDPRCFAVRREALDAIGGLDERFPAETLEMLDLARRAACAGWSTGWTRSSLVHALAPPSTDPVARERADLLLAAKWRDDDMTIDRFGSTTSAPRETREGVAS